jgi:hypothetical protein
MVFGLLRWITRCSSSYSPCPTRSFAFAEPPATSVAPVARGRNAQKSTAGDITGQHRASQTARATAAAPADALLEVRKESGRSGGCEAEATRDTQESAVTFRFLGSCRGRGPAALVQAVVAICVNSRELAR